VNALLYIGLAIMVAANLWFVFLAFKHSIIWGLFVLLIPGAALIFLIKNWKESRWAWWLALFGGLLCLIQKAINS
jgi:hypothetical protein